MLAVEERRGTNPLGSFTDENFAHALSTARAHSLGRKSRSHAKNCRAAHVHVILKKRVFQLIQPLALHVSIISHRKGLLLLRSRGGVFFGVILFCAEMVKGIPVY